MDEYLDYLKERLDKPNKTSGEGKAKVAEFNRALDFARRKGLTERYALDK